MEDINALIINAYRLLIQSDIKNGTLSPNGFSQELLHHIDIVPFKNIENIIAKVMEYRVGLSEQISNSIQAATVFWFMEDLCRVRRLTPFVNICNFDILSYYYAYHAMQTVYEKDIWKNTDFWRYIMIKILLRYFGRFYELGDRYVDMLLPNKQNTEEEKDKFFDYLLISLIKSSEPLFFHVHTDLTEAQKVCQQKIDEKYKEVPLKTLIKIGKMNQHKLSLAIEDYYGL